MVLQFQGSFSLIHELFLHSESPINKWEEQSLLHLWFSSICYLLILWNRHWDAPQLNHLPRKMQWPQWGTQ